MHPSILYQDSHILVLNKPAGITVNRADTTKGEETVQDWVEKEFRIQNSEFRMNDEESDFYKRAGIVHRLDKETSGILLVAKTPEAFLDLQRQFKERLIKKTYLALVHGGVQPEEGTINVPVGRLPWNRKRFGVMPGGRESLTRYKVIKTFASAMRKEKAVFSFLELYPETGRTHQIRVHLRHINHPIFADFLYGGRKQARDDRKILNRVFLHAHTISFVHPSTKLMVAYESPLPQELTFCMEQLEKRSDTT